MMKNILFLAAFVAMVFGPGCEKANLFESPKSETEQTFGFGPSGEITVAMDMQGGFAGVSRHLSIASNGYVRYMDDANAGEQIVSMLQPQEYDALVAYFLEKDFLNLEESYVEPNAADVFIYHIRFQHGGREKTVGADDVRAPANLRDLIARLHSVIDDLKQNALVLSFHMDRQSLQHGQTVELVLTATNQRARALQLASGVQMFEFFALPAAAAPRLPAELQTPYAWNYTHGKVYIAIMQYTTLAPGESLTFRAAWDGRGNNGEWLEGAYLLGAQLASAPGGFTALQPLQIVKR